MKCKICTLWFCDSIECRKKLYRKRWWSAYKKNLDRRSYFRKRYLKRTRPNLFPIWEYQKEAKVFIPDTRWGLKYDRRRKPDTPRRQRERAYRKIKRELRNQALNQDGCSRT